MEAPTTTIDQETVSEDASLGEDTNTLYLRHCELNYVKVKDLNQYFTLKTLGVEPFYLYRNTAQNFMGKLHGSIEKAIALTQELEAGEKIPDGSWYEVSISENEDPKSQLRFRLNLVVSVFNGKPYLHLRNYVYLKEQEMWQPTRRGLRLAIDESECNRMKSFMYSKMKNTPLRFPELSAANGQHTPKN